MESFWCKIMFKEFIKHFRKLDDKAIIKDVKDSMDALENLDGSGDSFGAKMIAWSNARIEENRKQRVEAGKKSGQARAKNRLKNLAAEDGGDREASQNVATAEDAKLESGTSSPQDFSVSQETTRPGVRAPGRSKRRFIAPTTQDLYNFCADNELDEADARDCFEMCSEREWKDHDGKQIVDWKKFIRGFCDYRQNKRREAC